MKKNTSTIIIALLALVTIIFCALFFSKSSQLNSLSAEKDAQLEALENQKNREIEVLQSAGKDKDQKIETLTAETDSKTETIEVLTTEAEKLSSELAEKNELIEEFKSDAAEKDETIRSLTTETAKKDDTIAALEQDLNEMNDQISSYKEAVSNLQSQIDEIYNSFYVIPKVTAEATDTSDFIYVSNGTEIQINGYRGNGGQVVIPDYIDGMPVTRIADRAFYNQDGITGIVLPANLKTIGDSAFVDLSNLTGIIVIPESVTSIGGHSFQMTNITGLVIKSSCTLAVNSFANNSSLEFVYIADGCAVQIGTAVFSYGNNLTTFVVPDDTSVIKDETFKGCNLLVFYSPTGSAAEAYAQKNFIQVNTADYEAQNEFFKNSFQ